MDQEKGVGPRKKSKVRKQWILESKGNSFPKWMKGMKWLEKERKWHVHSRYADESAVINAIKDLKKKKDIFNSSYRIIPPEGK